MTTHTLDGLALSAGMIWQDEFDWSPALSAQEYSLTGALVVDVAVRQAGRPFTLSGEADHGWIRRSALQSLYQLVNTSTGPLSLTLADGRGLNYTLGGSVEAGAEDGKPRSYKIERKSALAPVPGLPGVLR